MGAGGSGSRYNGLPKAGRAPLKGPLGLSQSAYVSPRLTVNVGSMVK